MKEKPAAFWRWFMAGKPLTLSIDQNGIALPAPTPEKARELFRTALTNKVEDGWKIEIENQFDAVLSRKKKQTWISKLVIFLILLIFIFPPIALFYLVVVIISSVNSKSTTLRIWIDEDGHIQQR